MSRNNRGLVGQFATDEADVRRTLTFRLGSEELAGDPLAIMRCLRLCIEDDWLIRPFPVGNFMPIDRTDSYSEPVAALLAG